MANYYTHCSAIMKIDDSHRDQAQQIINTTINQIVERESFCSVIVTLNEEGVWLRDNGSFQIEHLQEIAQALVEGLNLETPFYFTWANTCDKDRPDAFSGGAGVVRRGKPAVFVDPLTTLIRRTQLRTKNKAA